MFKDEINQLFDDQLKNWDTAQTNYKALSQVKEKVFCVNGNTYKVQFNPARITSSAAKVDPKSIQERKCFLCGANLPAQQKGIPYLNGYTILVNPFPIFPRHLTIPDREHTDQSLTPTLSKGEGVGGNDILNTYYEGTEKANVSPNSLSFGEGRGEAKRYYETANCTSYDCLKENKQNLKENQTECERIIWEMVRNNQLGHKFRRQHIISDFIVDFICISKKLIVEIDGGYHTNKLQIEKDEERTKKLNNLGFQVIRFTNEEVVGNPEYVRESLIIALSRSLTPTLSKGEGVVGNDILNKTNKENDKSNVSPNSLSFGEGRGEARIADMLDLAYYLDDFVIFYNGPKCGASAPDHFHFQAGNKGFLPIEEEWNTKKAGKVIEAGVTTLWYLDDAPRSTLVIESHDVQCAMYFFQLIYESMETGANDPEPMMNILAWSENGKYTICVFPREKHRPDCYFAEGENNLLISPAAVDLGGVFITPQEKDFNKITEKDISCILTEISLNPEKFNELREKIRSKHENNMKK